MLDSHEKKDGSTLPAQMAPADPMAGPAKSAAAPAGAKPNGAVVSECYCARAKRLVCKIFDSIREAARRAFSWVCRKINHIVPDEQKNK